jgi:hypothetical protein
MFLQLNEVFPWYHPSELQGGNKKRLLAWQQSFFLCPMPSQMPTRLADGLGLGSTLFFSMRNKPLLPGSPASMVSMDLGGMIFILRFIMNRKNQKVKYKL